MGGDGGSFSGRAEMVRTKGFKFLRNLGGMGYTPNTQIRAGDERLSKNENRDLQTSACALSEEKLKPPIVACRLGRLYNKEKVISSLLEKSLPPHMKHIKSLKDMRDCEVEINSSTGFPVCPITKADLSSGARATIIWPCGFIVSNRALHAITNKETEGSNLEKGSEGSWKLRLKGIFTCPMCSKEHSASEDLIPLSPDEEDIPALLEKALAYQQARKGTKKFKASKVQPAEPTVSPQQDADPKSLPSSEPSALKRPLPPTLGAVEENMAGAEPSKRLRDWVLEFEAGISTEDHVKHRKVAT